MTDVVYTSGAVSAVDYEIEAAHHEGWKDALRRKHSKAERYAAVGLRVYYESGYQMGESHAAMRGEEPND